MIGQVFRSIARRRSRRAEGAPQDEGGERPYSAATRVSSPAAAMRS